MVDAVADIVMHAGVGQGEGALHLDAGAVAKGSHAIPGAAGAAFLAEAGGAVVEEGRPVDCHGCGGDI